MRVKDAPFLAVPDIGGEKKPVLPIVIINPDNGLDFSTWGQIDTGADEIIIPEHIARKIGHNIRNVKPRDAYSASGPMDVYEHTFKIQVLPLNNQGLIDKRQKPLVIPRKKIGVVFGLSHVLLGVSDLLEDYILQINYPAQRFSIWKPRK